MKVLITGINGMLGTTLLSILREKHEVFGIDIVTTEQNANVLNVNLTDFDATYKAITQINPDLVIHTAAQTNVDKCEIEPDMAYMLNSIATRNVAVCCQRFDTVLLYISTDYVFSGEAINRPKEGYTEYDDIYPSSVYAKSKYEGERYVKSLLNKYFIVRSSWLYGAKRKNFITQAADSCKDGKVINMADDMVSSPTYVNDLAKAISMLIETQMYGLYHITNNGFASRYEIAKTVAKMLNSKGDNIRKVSLKELNLPAKRPSFSAMRNYVWLLNGFDALRPWQNAVKEFLIENNYL